MMVPPGGDAVARFGVIAGVYPTFLDIGLRPDDYGMTISLEGASPTGALVAATMTTWGVPADPAHDTERCTPAEALGGCTESPPRHPGPRRLGLLTNPTACGTPLSVGVAVSSWAEPSRFATASAELPPINGCDRLGFAPSLTIQPTSHRAGAPTGLDLRLALPGPEGPDVPESSELRALSLQLPAGMTLAPPALDGLAACSAQEVGLGNSESAHCPPASTIGEAELEVPALGLIDASLHLRSPEPGDPYRFWLTSDEAGIHLKQAGELRADPRSGRLDAAVLDLPQVPLRSALLRFRAGSRALLANPRACGAFPTAWQAVPWSGGPPIAGTATFSVEGGCAAPAFSPRLLAGSTNAAAGAGSTFVFDLSLRDGEGGLSRFDLDLPEGISAALAGVPRCPEDLAGPCPADSRLGSLAIAAGPGSEPLWLPEQGRPASGVYLAGPYHGAPLSLIFALPAQAGPFDFGSVSVRAALTIDPLTGAIGLRADPLPQILAGIPIAYREIHIELDRPGLIHNPTSCAPQRITATAISTDGATAHLQSPFRASDCAALPFRPTVALHLIGGLARNAHPGLRAVLRTHSGEAAIAEAGFTLPPGELLDLHHLRALCAPDLTADQCPSASRLGYARLWSPLVDGPLEGPIYLREPADRLPDLLADLQGGGVHIVLHGHTAAPAGRLRISFPNLPDVPFSKATFSLPGGRRGIFANTESLCADAGRGQVNLAAHNGKHRLLRPRLRVPC